MKSNEEIVQVIAIVGLSNCGSTITNLILDSHPSIYGGGELYYLLEKRKRKLHFDVVCTSCLEQCPIWTPERIGGISEDAFYNDIFQYTGTRIIVDSSKFLSWFLERENAESNIQMLYVLCAKHPVRQTASLYLNGQLYGYKETQDINYNIFRIHNDYFRAINKLEKEKKPYIFLRYEDIVDNPGDALTPLLNHYSLHYYDQMNRFYDIKHHQIAGNNGAIYVCEEKWHPWAPIDKLHDIRRKQYENNKKKGLFIDNKYKEVLTEAQIYQVQEAPRIAALMKAFGYKPIEQ